MFLGALTNPKHYRSWVGSTEHLCSGAAAVTRCPSPHRCRPHRCRVALQRGQSEGESNHLGFVRAPTQEHHLGFVRASLFKICFNLVIDFGFMTPLKPWGIKKGSL